MGPPRCAQVLPVLLPAELNHRGGAKASRQSSKCIRGNCVGVPLPTMPCLLSLSEDAADCATAGGARRVGPPRCSQVLPVLLQAELNHRDGAKASRQSSKCIRGNCVGVPNPPLRDSVLTGFACPTAGGARSRAEGRLPASPVGAGFRVQGSGCRVHGSGCRVQGVGCRVQGAGCRIQGAGCEVEGLGFRV